MPSSHPLKMQKSRYAAIIVITLVMTVVMLLRFVQFQVIEADEISAAAAKSAQQTLQIKAARGDIVDRYGRTIATTGMSYSVMLQKGNFPTKKEHEKRLETILRLYEILETNGETILQKLPIDDNLDNPQFIAEMSSEIAVLKDMLDKQSYATAQNCVDALVARYKLENLSAADARKVMNIRYLMERGGFESYTPVEIAAEVSVATLIAVKEHQDSLPGAVIASVPYRVYERPTTAAHLIGYTGPIYAEEYAELKTQGYKMNDTLGKAGVEKLAEIYLRGTDGTTLEELNSDDTGTTTIKNAQPGDTVVLTLDARLQEAAQKTLEETIKSIAEKGKNSSGKQGADANAGAVVVMEVNTGDILAAATYPTYSITDILSDYNALLIAESQPLYNRAFQGLYEPGSAYKPLVAVAALETGVIRANTALVCNKVYRYYTDYQPSCLGTHGSITLRRALAVSCNCFFYETGRLTTINNIVDYAKQFGLGQKSGIGLPESTGSISGPEYSASKNKIWVPGDTLQAAIGQGDNLYTPLQLASYVATLSNGGTRYQPRLIKSVVSKDGTETLVADEPVVLNTVNMSESTLNAVLEGMRSVTSDGTGSAVFGSYAIEVGGKTGSAQVPSGTANAVFIAFAPYDEPEIAIAIVIEHGWHGGDAAGIARAVFDEYFFPEVDLVGSGIGVPMS